MRGIILLIASVLLLGAVNICTAQDAVEIKSELFELRDIKLLSGPLKEGQDLNRLYLLKLEPDRMLSWFRKEAGLEPKADPYKGWESQTPLLPGHILAFYMSGASMMVQATVDKVLHQRLDYIIDELDKVQKANGCGYIMAIPGGKEFFNNVAAGQIDIKGLPWNGYQINGVFAPVYTINKLLLGLYQVYLATESKKAKEVCLKFADWFGTEVIDKLSDQQLQTLLQCEHGSIHESYVDTYTLSGDAKYLKWARRLCHERMLRPLAEGNTNFITNFHANANIPKYTGFEHIYRSTGERSLHAAAMNFWNDVVARRSWVIGGNSAKEHFFDPNAFSKALNELAGPETCNSINMLRLTEALFETEPSAKMMDYYERVLFNHILSAHENERGMIAYYTPMFAGAYRIYSSEFDSMWCCVGTGLEVPGKYGQMIYTHSPDNQSLNINLFAASELNWKARGVVIRQTTDFPYEPSTRLTIRCNNDTDLTIQVRHPSWIPDGHLKINVNGSSISNDSKGGCYVSIRRNWKNGDVIDVELPMHLTTEYLGGSNEYAAILYGPIVLSGRLGLSGGLTAADFRHLAGPGKNKPMPQSEVPFFTASSVQGIVSQIKPVEAKPLHFRTEGLAKPQNVELVPFFENYFERYAIYWRLSNPAAK